MAGSLKIIQLSDMHLFADTKKELLGVNTQESFAAVLQLLRDEKENMDLIFLSGDISQDGSVAAYERIAKMVSEFKVPVYWILGNHDNEQVIQKYYPLLNIINEKQILNDHWQLVLLNSQKPKAVEGLLEQSELAFLENCLKAYPHLPTLVLLHHQALPVGVVWLDKLGLTNAQDFWKIITPHPQVKVVICGHVHQESHQQYKGVDCYTVPSTCIQFNPRQNEFALDNIPPGYRWIQLSENSKFTTGVKRLSKYIGHFDKSAKGY